MKARLWQRPHRVIRDRDIPRACHVHVLWLQRRRDRALPQFCRTLRRQHLELSLTVMAPKSKAR